MVKASASNIISAADILSASKNKVGGSCPINLERFEKIGKLNGHNYMYKVAKMLVDMDKT